jgi:hypothetical protein
MKFVLLKILIKFGRKYRYGLDDEGWALRYHLESQLTHTWLGWRRHIGINVADITGC